MQGSCQGKESGKGATDLPGLPPSSEHPTASAPPVSLLVAWIVARVRRRNFKRLQSQDRQSIKSEKCVEGVEGRPWAGQGGDKEDMTQGKRKRPPFSRPPGSQGGGKSHRDTG